MEQEHLVLNDSYLCRSPTQEAPQMALPVPTGGVPEADFQLNFCLMSGLLSSDSTATWVQGTGN